MTAIRNKVFSLFLPLAVILLVAYPPSLIRADEEPVSKQLQEPETQVQTPGKRRDKSRLAKSGGKSKSERSYTPPEHAWELATTILGRPTGNSIAISVYPAISFEAYIEFGTEENGLGARTASQRLNAQTPAIFELDGLSADTRYFYRLRYRSEENAGFSHGPDYSFHTQRKPGSTFSFQVQGDSHPERNPKQHLPAMYEQTLLAVAADQPDFYLAMGDDFSIDTLREVTRQTVEQVYLRHLPYLGLVGHSSPLFLVNGNHEQAAKYLLNGTPDNAAVWAQTSRNRYFPQPAPNDFYGGNPQEVEHIGLLRNYFSWTWGDALFVTIDPYWHSEVAVDGRLDRGNKSRDQWKKTLGETQYQWLKQTLEQSDSKFKFVFAHHVNGGGRGGVKLANLYEWGGYNNKGQYEFSEQRPGWAMPIHQLMAKNNVSIFFQGHDHVFATEEKDGVIYQTLPEPADPNYTLYFKEAYTGTVLPNSGRVRVTVSPRQVDVEYIATVLPADENEQRKNNAVVHRYSVTSGR
jgi:hypothetical protein